MTLTVHLTGYLGSDPSIRSTQEKTYVLAARERPQDSHVFCYGPGRPIPDPEGDLPIEADAPIEITRPSRQYAALSIATHHGGQTVWHQLRAFSIDPDHPHSRYHDLFAVRLARKGDRVEAVGRVKTWDKPDDGGTFRYLELVSLRILKTKRPPVGR